MEAIIKSDETQEILSKVKHVKNVAHKGKVTQPATRFSTLRERQELQKELRDIESTLNAPAWAKENITQKMHEELYERRENIEAQIEGTSPPKLDGKAKDALNSRLQELEGEIKTGMLSEEEMWRNPAGAVDRHRKWEAKNKDKILERRNILIALEPESDDIEYTSIETLRPSIARQSEAATFMADSKLPGHFAMSPLAKANFEKTFPESPTISTPLKQAERREAKNKEGE